MSQLSILWVLRAAMDTTKKKTPVGAQYARPRQAHSLYQLIVLSIKEKSSEHSSEHGDLPAIYVMDSQFDIDMKTRSPEGTSASRFATYVYNSIFQC